MKNVHLTNNTNKPGWTAKTGSGDTFAKGATKDVAVKATARKAKADPVPVSVKTHRQDGKIQQERTYPRKADPRGSKG